MPDLPYGYWSYNNGTQNALYGAASSFEDLPDGRRVLVKNPDYPAVLEDEFILFALRRSEIARRDFNRLFPTMDVVSQERLTDMINNNPQVKRLVMTDQEFCDNIQKHDVTQGVRTRMPVPRG